MRKRAVQIRPSMFIFITEKVLQETLLLVSGYACVTKDEFAGVLWVFVFFTSYQGT